MFLVEKSERKTVCRNVILKKKKCKNSLKKHIFVYFVKKKTTLVTVFLMK